MNHTQPTAGIMDKQSFAAFITQKRKAAGMTQEELAGRLYVTHTTVSKWERGLSYPDISLVPAVCRTLQISEHEFFTACDDIGARRQEKDAAHWRLMVWGWQLFFLIGYGITVLTCFICNLAISHRLDWFFIVLASLALAFCLTSLPFFLHHRERAAICLLAASICLLLLLLACGIYTGGDWLGAGFAITAVCLLLPWSLYALWRFYGKHLLLLGFAVLTAWTFLLLTVIALVVKGDWLLSVAYPVAGYCYAFLWAYFAVIRWLPAGGFLKASVCTLITAMILPLSTAFATWLVGPGSDGMTFGAYFDWNDGLLHTVSDGNVVGNRAIFAALLAAAAVLLIIGTIREISKRRKK